MKISALDVTAGKAVQYPPTLLIPERSVALEKKPIQDLAAGPSPVQE
jgi:hypothetical protein